VAPAQVQALTVAQAQAPAMSVA
jgi:hypothetical protein